MNLTPIQVLSLSQQVLLQGRTSIASPLLIPRPGKVLQRRNILKPPGQEATNLQRKCFNN